MNYINELSNQFLQEAISSPILFNDLANMEKYISESYQMRSIIELLQNADDANSTKFKIFLDGTTLYVGNDGRDFDYNDLVSICRSGASTKKDRDIYIGYRGIGFKSVVNFSENIHVISKDVTFSFSKKLTVNLLYKHGINGDVPLIRVPHEFEKNNEFDSIISQFKSDGYTVIFIFEDINIDVITQEIQNYTPNTLLFLKNVNTVNITTSEYEHTYTATRKIETDYSLIDIASNSIYTSWVVLHFNESNVHEAIAFLKDDLTSSDKTESFLVYSFLPTKVETGFKFIINGSFSTDPSRTQVILDSQTTKSLNKVIQLIIENVKRTIEKPTVHSVTLLNLIANLTIDPLAKFKTSFNFKDTFITTLLKELNKLKINLNGNLINVKDIYLQPEWLNIKDYEKVCKLLNYLFIDNKIYKQAPHLKALLGSLEINNIDVVSLINRNFPFDSLSSKGNLEIIKQYIKQTRFNLTTEKINDFKKSNLFNLLEDTAFRDSLNTIIDENDVLWFLTKLGFNTEKNIKKTKSIDFNLTTQNKTRIFSSKFSKWRSVEINVQSYFENLDDVTSVIDVSKSNLGYDLEVYRADKVEFVEVKSVNQLGDSFSLTNNEYGVANEKKDAYLLAIVKQTDTYLELCIIQNPLETIQLNRRVTRWEWICDEYQGDLKEFNLE